MYFEISSSPAFDCLHDAAARYLRTATGRWAITDAARLEAGLEELGIAADVEVGMDGVMRIAVLPLAVALADEREAA